MSQTKTSKCSSILTIFLTCCNVNLAIAKEVPCYALKCLDTAWTDRPYFKVNMTFTCLSYSQVPCYALKCLDTAWTDRPYFKVNMTFSDEGNIKSHAWIEKDIAYPVSKLRVSQMGGTSRVLQSFNVTARLCEIQRSLDKIPVIKGAFLSATKESNLTLECPLKAGFYVMNNIRFDKGSRVLAFMYRPKESYIFEGGLYEELTNKKLLALTTYRFTAKVVKQTCKA